MFMITAEPSVLAKKERRKLQNQQEMFTRPSSFVIDLRIDNLSNINYTFCDIYIN